MVRASAATMTSASEMRQRVLRGIRCTFTTEFLLRANRERLGVGRVPCRPAPAAVACVLLVGTAFRNMGGESMPHSGEIKHHPSVSTFRAGKRLNRRHGSGSETTRPDRRRRGAGGGRNRHRLARRQRPRERRGGDAGAGARGDSRARVPAELRRTEPLAEADTRDRRRAAVPDGSLADRARPRHRDGARVLTRTTSRSTTSSPRIASSARSACSPMPTAPTACSSSP